MVFAYDFIGRYNRVNNTNRKGNDENDLWIYENQHTKGITKDR